MMTNRVARLAWTLPLVLALWNVVPARAETADYTLQIKTRLGADKTLVNQKITLDFKESGPVQEVKFTDGTASYKVSIYPNLLGDERILSVYVWDNGTSFPSAFAPKDNRLVARGGPFSARAVDFTFNDSNGVQPFQRSYWVILTRR